MHILLIGASGMIGSRIVAEAVARGHSVTGVARDGSRIPALAGVKAVSAQVDDTETLLGLARDGAADVIVGSVSPRSTGDAIAESAAIGAALMTLARRSGLRLVVVGGAGSLLTPDGQPIAETLPDAYRNEALGFRNFRDSLKASDLDWTFVSPPAFIHPGERTGAYRLGTTTLIVRPDGSSEISAEDYAIALVDELEAANSARAQMAVGW